MTQFAFVFPGQGSQSVGMLDALAQARPEVAQTFSEAGEVIGVDLWQLVREGPIESLNQTEITQPAMLAADIAVWRVWQALDGPAPEVVAGHSLGEYAALVAAGAIDFVDAVAIVAERGRLMQEAVPEGKGAMAAILGLDDEVVEAICREVAEGQIVSPANYNSPGQLVIAGESTAVERAMHKCLDAGARRAMLLPVSVPSHCKLMDPAAEQLARRLEQIEIRTPTLDVLHNVNIQSHKKPENIRKALINQMSSPVRWTGTIRAIAARGIDRLGECGPGRVLAGLGRRIDKQLAWVALEQPDAIGTAAAEWREDNA